MKKLKNLLGIIVIGMVIGFTLAGCSNPAGDAGDKEKTTPQSVTYTSIDSENNRYTLTITENTGEGRAAYVPQGGDRFTLTVELFKDDAYSVSLTCSGTVQGFSETTLNLQLSVNNAPLTITIANGEMTVISGTLVSDDGETTQEAPAAITPEEPAASVYVAGTYGAGIPCYWKNGVKTDLPLGGNSRGMAEKIIVENGKVYVLGIFTDATGNGKSGLWTNGTLSMLSNGNAHDFTVSNGVVYMAGSYSVEFSVPGYGDTLFARDKPCYWRNGVRTDLIVPEPAVTGYFPTSGRARQITIAGTTVYIAGEYRVPEGDEHLTLCYWINGLRNDLSNSLSNPYVTAIAVSNGDVFMTGYDETLETNTSQAWSGKNSTVAALQAGICSRTYGIAVSGSDVYVTGFSGSAYDNVQACYWKNGAIHYLPERSEGMTSCGYSIAVLNGDVYAAGAFGGESTSSACYWKNDTRIILQPGNASANGIFVVQR